MDSKSARRLLSAYLDGELKPDEREALENALAADESLRADLDELKAVSRLIRAHARAEAPARLRAKVLSETKRPAGRPRLTPALGLSLGGAVAAAIAVGVVSDRIRQGGFEPPPAMISHSGGELRSLAAPPELEQKGLAPGFPAPEPRRRRAAETFDEDARIEGTNRTAFSTGGRFDASEPSAADALKSADRASGKANEAAREDAGLGLRSEARTGALLYKSIAPPAEKPARVAARNLLDARAARWQAAEKSKAPRGALAAAPPPKIAAQSVAFSRTKSAAGESDEAKRAPMRFEGGAPLEELAVAGAKKSAAEQAPSSGWSGTALYGPARDTEVLIREMEPWLKLWPLVSTDAVPLIDFSREMVVGFIAGAEPGGSVQLVEVADGSKEIVVRYRRTAAEGPAIPSAYQLKVIPRSNLPVRFERLD